MNRSKSAAVLMLAGAFAAGVGSSYAATAVAAARRASRPDCPQQRSDDNDYKKRFYADIGLDLQQQLAFDSLIDKRNKAVNEVFAIPRAASESLFASARAKSDSLLAGPRAKADSIRTATREKQNALFTPAQRAKVEERQAAMKQLQAERQKMCDPKNKSNH